MARLTQEAALTKYEHIKQFLFDSAELCEDQKNGLRALFDHLDKETNWLLAPASTRFHNSFDGGLLQHSINVVNAALQIKKSLAPDLSDASIIIIALLHDCGKHNAYKRKDPTPRQQQFGYPGSIGVNEDIPYMEHEDRSLVTIMRYYPYLTDEEFCAIAQHNEPWLTTTSQFKPNRYMTILQNADYWSCMYLDDPGDKY